MRHILESWGSERNRKNVFDIAPYPPEGGTGLEGFRNYLDTFSLIVV